MALRVAAVCPRLLGGAARTVPRARPALYEGGAQRYHRAVFGARGHMSAPDSKHVPQHTRAVQRAVRPLANAAYDEPWMERPSDVDDASLELLIEHLDRLRFWRRVSGTLTAAVGAVFGVLAQVGMTERVLIGVTCAAMFALPTHAIASLVVRQSFLRLARQMGLSRKAAMLAFVRAGRAARHLPPGLPASERTERVRDAVRDWEQP